MLGKNCHVNAYAREAAYARTCVSLKNIHAWKFSQFHGELHYYACFAVMVIGFTERRRTVSEGLFPDSDEFQLEIDVATFRVSEREHRMLYRVLSSGTATVVSFAFFDNLDFDARFGVVQADPIEQRDQLLPGRNFTGPLRTGIRNDFVPEYYVECYSIQISPIDIPDLRELFTCDFVDTSSTPPRNFFCEHTICIEDDDGKLHTRESIKGRRHYN